jgi:hypothetical protein
MMKKLLILMLVFGITSAANATVLSWSVDDITITIGDSAVVQLVSDDDLAYAAKWVGQEPSTFAVIDSIVGLANAGDAPVIKDPTLTVYPGWWTVEALDFEPPSTIAPGAQYDVTITGLALGTYLIDSDSYGTGGGFNDVLTINVVPEPMTIALLGLGGLFLLRRRK